MNILDMVKEIKNISFVKEYHNLSSTTFEEKILYLHGLSMMMNIDDEIHEKELALLEILIDAFDAPLDSSELIEFAKNPTKEPLEDIMSFIQNFQLSNVFLFDCILMLKIDNKERSCEKQLLKTFAEQSRISEKDIVSLGFFVQYLLFFAEDKLDLNFNQTVKYIYEQLREVEYVERIMYFKDGTLKYIGGKAKGYIFSINEEADYLSKDSRQNPLFYKGEITFEEEYETLYPIPSGRGQFFSDDGYVECESNSHKHIEHEKRTIKAYYFNGQLHFTCEVEDIFTVTSDQVKIFNEEGHLTYEGDYFDSNVQGKSDYSNGVLYHKNGSIFFTGEFNNKDEFHIGEIYKDNGELYYQGFFQDGNPKDKILKKDAWLEINLSCHFSCLGPSSILTLLLIMNNKNKVLKEQCVLGSDALNKTVASLSPATIETMRSALGAVENELNKK